MFQSKILTGDLYADRNIKIISMLLVLVFAAILRVGFLFTPHKYPSGEEAIYGLMAKQLIEGGSISVKPYGVSYAGGIFIETYLMVPVFKFFGISDFTLKGVIIFLSLISLLSVMILGVKLFGARGGLAWGILYGFCPMFARWNLIARGGYIELLIFIPVLVLTFIEIYRKMTFKNIMLFGVISSIAFWNQPLILSLLIAFSLIIFFLNIKFFFITILKLFFYVFLFILPRIITEILKGSFFLNQFTPLFKPVNFFFRLARFFYFDLPASLSSENLDNFLRPVSAISYIWYGIVGIPVIYFIVRYAVSLKNYNFRVKDFSFDDKDIVIVLFILSIAVHAILYSFLKTGGASPRYLLPVIFYLIGMLAFFIIEIINSNKLPVQMSVSAVLFLIITITISEYLVLFQEKRTVNDWLIKSNGEDLVKTVDFLKNNDYKYVYSNCFIQSRIMFESNESIIASSRYIAPMVYSYPLSETYVENADRFAYVVNADDPFCDVIIDRFIKADISYNKTRIGDFVVIYNLSKNMRPAELFGGKKS